jgi:crotonobetainyl-CoA:carnitine CoA-transferase CaiB-like acyl-CoA transferase
MTTIGPLAGLSVLEVGHIVAGPTAGLVLGSLGADVVKIEPPGGEQTRNMTGLGAGVFPNLNRGKRSVVIDLKDSSDRDRFLEMVERADVLITNYAGDALARLGLDYASLAAINDRLIYGRIAGFPEGPYSDRPALDEVIQMMSGLAFMTGPAGNPMRAGASIIDISAANFLVIGVLGALRARDTSGLGQEVQVSLYETGLFIMGSQFVTRQLTGEESLPFPEHGLGKRYGWAVYDRFATSDQKMIFVAATSQGHWTSLCEAAELTHLLDDPLLQDHATRVLHRDTFLPQLTTYFAHHTYAATAELLEDRGVPYAPVWSPDDVLVDPTSAAGFRVSRYRGQDVMCAPVPIGGAWDSSSFETAEPPELDDRVVRADLAPGRPS